jgi:hypothetical protein
MVIKDKRCPAHSDLFHLFARFWWSDKNFMILELLYGEAIWLILILLPETDTRILIKQGDFVDFFSQI